MKTPIIIGALIGFFLVPNASLAWSRHRTPAPTPVSVQTPANLILGAFNANVGTVRANFLAWGDAPTCYAGKTTFIYLENTGVSLDQIINGSQDQVIRNFASQVCQGAILSVFHEMNLADGSNDWAGFVGSNSPQKVVAAYRHIHDIIGSKVRYAWVINNSDWPNQTGNRPSDYYPGSAYVDIAAVDGFDWGGETFMQAISPNLNVVKGYGKPVWITSFGTANTSKQAAWVTDAINQAKANGIQGLVYFSYNDGLDFTLNGAAIAAFHI